MREKIFYRRNLPHFQPDNAIYFVTFRLANSLPKSVIDELKKENNEAIKKINLIPDVKFKDRKLYHQQKRYFGKFDALLDTGSTGPLWLKEKKVAKIVFDALFFRDTKEYELYAFCIMPNHVHLLCIVSRIGDSTTRNTVSGYILTEILRGLKRYTAMEANKILGRSGQFWHRESYDHVVRNEKEFENIMRYILMNPQNAGLIKDWKEWKWTYSYFGENL